MRILRGLTSRLLPCGCIAGVYETYDGTVVTLLDHRHAHCHESAHIAGREIPDVSGIAPAADATAHTTRPRNRDGS
jgi:hypothetical protein